MIGESIKRLRQARNMSQVELAFHLNVTKQSVSNWENNNILPSIEMLVKIAKFFSVSTDYILGLDNRDYIEVTGLTDRQLGHVRSIIDDILGREWRPEASYWLSISHLLSSFAFVQKVKSDRFSSLWKSLHLPLTALLERKVSPMIDTSTDFADFHSKIQLRSEKFYDIIFWQA